jgi:hypothetical protein
MAFEMRMRGYDVQAGPTRILDKYGYGAGRTMEELDEQLAALWQLPGGKSHDRSFASQEWRTFDAIDREIIAEWPDGARGYMTVGKHVFNVLKQNGKVRYIEAQFDASPSRVVTGQYRRKFRSADMFSTGKPAGEAKVIRLDDLVPTDGILESVTVA